MTQFDKLDFKMSVPKGYVPTSDENFKTGDIVNIVLDDDEVDDDYILVANINDFNNDAAGFGLIEVKHKTPAVFITSICKNPDHWQPIRFSTHSKHLQSVVLLNNQFCVVYHSNIEQV